MSQLLANGTTQDQIMSNVPLELRPIMDNMIRHVRSIGENKLDPARIDQRQIRSPDAAVRFRSCPAVNNNPKSNRFTGHVYLIIMYRRTSNY